jgi:hypothetical protein
MKEDGTGKKKVIPDPVIYLIAVSPDGRWVVAWVAHQGEETTQALVAYPVGWGPKQLRGGRVGTAIEMTSRRSRWRQTLLVCCQPIRKESFPDFW